MMAIVAAAPTFAADVILPDGKGRDAVENACTVCHTADRITRQSMTVDQWRSEIRTMVENGASLNPDEWDPVVQYLAKNFGPKVNLNTATAQQISAGLELTPAEAEAIVTYRAANGSFKEIADLAKVPAFDIKKIAGRENRIAF